MQFLIKIHHAGISVAVAACCWRRLLRNSWKALPKLKVSPVYLQHEHSVTFPQTCCNVLPVTLLAIQM
ncbi:hypothetical protein [Thiothrix fructosivorans]|uniref:Uncharacterized protein n=1 Tax=Thiothrix fructosivorans TaxID=111770 RepID=A0A8B0SE07_9GAMM|nr:hypothetical protein [Thiothrix fructosivorans]QTX10253.1 hypothetical protein J1836_016930 [Thiothrix fructosivorans]